MNSISKSAPSILSQLVDILEQFDERDKTILLTELRKNLIVKRANIIDRKISKAHLKKLNNQQIIDLCRVSRNELSKKQK